MKVRLTDCEYDTLLLPIEWRYSASLVGLVKYFDYIEEKEGYKLYSLTNESDEILKSVVYEQIGGYIQGIMYNQSDLTEERYLNFCEEYYSEYFQHKKIEGIIGNSENYSDEQIAAVNALMTGQAANTILKKIFGKLKFDGTNGYEILELIENHRYEIIRETYRYKHNLYSKYANTNKLFTNSNPHCRLLGYDLDEGRKSKAASYMFDTSTFIGNDEFEFDFIPFAFSDSRDSFFINNNCSVDALVKSNDKLHKLLNNDKEEISVVDNKVKWDSDKTKLIKALIEFKEGFIDFDVEIIAKEIDKKTGDNKEYFETLYIRKKSLKKLANIYSKTNLRFYYNYQFNYRLDVEEEVINCCLNNVLLDGLIKRVLVISVDKDYEYAIPVVNKLVAINSDWKGGKYMSEATESAKKVGYIIGTMIFEKSGENKVRSYRNQLTNAIVANDYDRVLKIMMQLSSYVETEISTVYKIIDNKSDWCDIAVAFTNSLLGYKVKERVDKK